MEAEYAGADFDVRSEVEAAFGHGSVKKWDRKDLYVRKWLERETKLRPARSTRMAVTTDWNQDFFEGTE